jgi:hypothetical protein
MHVIFLTHYYPPEVGAPQARISSLAHALTERGTSVTVHTCFPHYPDGRIREPYRNWPYLKENDGPVRVVRSAVYPAPNRGFLPRLANHLSSALSAIATAPLTGAADVVVAESPPLFTAAAGSVYAGLKRVPLVLNVADRWPASAIELGMLRRPGFVRAASWLERSCYLRAAAITVPTDGLVRSLSAVPEASGKVVRIEPSVDLDAFEPAPRTRRGMFRVLYAGTVGLAQGLDTLIDAARIAGPNVVEVLVAGGGAEAEALAARVAAEAIPNVRMLGVVPHEDIPGLYAGADAGVVLLRDRPVFAGALPTKILEAMAAGRAVILAARGEAAQLVADHRVGVVVPPEDPSALAAAFAELAADPKRLDELGAAGRRCAVERFGRRDQAAQWWRLLLRVRDRRAVTGSAHGAQAAGGPRHGG